MVSSAAMPAKVTTCGSIMRTVLSRGGSFPGHGGEGCGEGEWIYFIHPPRDNFAATMTDEEKRVWGVHFKRFERLLATL